MKTLTWQKPGQQNVAQELIKIIINYVAELRVERKIAVVTILFKKIFIGKQYNEGHPKNQILLFSELSVEG